MSITHNKNLNPLLNLLINCILARSAPQILFMKSECNFLFSNILIIGLFNSYANCWFDILIFNATTSKFRITKFSDCAPVAEVFYQKIYKALKQVHVDVHHILGFGNIKCFITQYFIRSCSSI